MPVYTRFRPFLHVTSFGHTTVGQWPYAPQGKTAPLQIRYSRLIISRTTDYHRKKTVVESMTMTRAELIAILADRFPNLMAKDAEIAVKEIIDGLSAALARGDRVEIRGFGSFSLNYRPARVGRNPKTGETVHVPAKFAPHFKAGKEMRECIDRGDKDPSMKMAA